MALACVAAAGSAQPAPLTTLDSVRRLSNAEAAKGIPVAVTATVTYFRSYRKNMFVQDGSTGVFVKAATHVKLVPGDRVLIKGLTRAGYLPYVITSDLTLLVESQTTWREEYEDKCSDSEVGQEDRLACQYDLLSARLKDLQQMN